VGLIFAVSSAILSRTNAATLIGARAIPGRSRRVPRPVQFSRSFGTFDRTTSRAMRAWSGLAAAPARRTVHRRFMIEAVSWRLNLLHQRPLIVVAC